MIEPWILVWMHMASKRYQQNCHKRQIWQLGFQWHRRGIELVFKSPNCFKVPPFFGCYMYLLFGNFSRLIIWMQRFLTEASFGLRVLSSPASVCVSVCVCVSLCVNHLLVRAITRDLFKLGSPNLDQRCKRPWLRSLLFLGVIDIDLQGQI